MIVEYWESQYILWLFKELDTRVLSEYFGIIGKVTEQLYIIRLFHVSFNN